MTARADLGRAAESRAPEEMVAHNCKTVQTGGGQRAPRVKSEDFSFLELPEGPDFTFPELQKNRSDPVRAASVGAHAPSAGAETEKRSHHGTHLVQALDKISPGFPAARRAVPFQVGTCYPVLKDKLFFAVHRDDQHTMDMIEADTNLFYFSTHIHESYMPFCADFGPINLSGVISFCEFLDEKVNDKRLRKRPLVYYCSPNQEHLTNLAFLLGCYLVLCHGYEPEEVEFLDMFTKDTSPFLSFRDATFSKSLWDLSVLECLKGLQMARRVGCLKEEEFDQEDYDSLEDPANADLHQICDKFIAFKGPNDNPDDEFTFSPSHYVPIFKSKGVEAVIRLNEDTTYDPKPFTEAGIKHYDLFFQDCTVPPKDIVRKFFDICNAHDGCIAIHCLAGLGRTGTLIALWMMRYHNTKAAETIGWLRIVRPGSVIGLQQVFLARFDNFDWRKLSAPDQPGRASRDHPSKTTFTRSSSASARVGPSSAMESSAQISCPGRQFGGSFSPESKGSAPHLLDSLLSIQLAEQVKNGVRSKAVGRSKGGQ